MKPKKTPCERLEAVTVLQVSILIINYNGARHLTACLTALEEQSVSRDSFEVILLDNASSDNALSLVREQFPWVRLLASPVNLGFAQGNNYAATFAKSNTCILLNNDTVPDPHWLEELYRAMQEYPGCRLVSKLVFHREPERIQSAGLVILRDGRGTDYGFRASDLGQFEETRDVFAGCGAALLLPKPWIFDASYFLYYEDTQLGWSGQLAGERTIYVPRAVVRHVHGASGVETSPFFLFHVERNRTLTSLRHGDWILASLAVPSLLLRTGRAMVKAAIGKSSWSVAWAMVRACASLVKLAPRVLRERFMS